MFSASSARTTSASWASPSASRTAAPFGRAVRGLAEAGQHLARARRARPGRRGSTSTLGRPISAFSASGVPSATIRPWSMIPMRSASTSASSRYCVVRKTVTPLSVASRWTSSHSALRLCTSRPVVGSSRNRMRGPVDERERQVEPALHAARVAAHLAVGGLREPDALSSSSERRAPRAPRHAVQGGLEPHVLGAGQERVERGLLERGADRGAHLGALLDDVVPATRARARGGREQRGEHVDGRGLARAVRAEEAVHLAGLHAQVDAVDRARALLELPDEVRRLDGRFSHERPSVLERAVSAAIHRWLASALQLALRFVSNQVARLEYLFVCTTRLTTPGRPGHEASSGPPMRYTFDERRTI